MGRLFLCLWALTALASVAAAAEPAKFDASQVEFFEKKIRPVLAERCYQCHSEAARTKKKLRGGLLLDSKAAVLKGGESGPALVPGKANDILLLKALRYNGDPRMPPKGKLPDGVIADFESWINQGAPDPRTIAVAT